MRSGRVTIVGVSEAIMHTRDAEGGEPHDLRAFFHAVGHFSGDRALTSTPIERAEPAQPAELLDPGPVEVRAPLAPVAAFVDGIQAALVVTHRLHRPVYLNYVAAGAVDLGGEPVALAEDLWVTCSTLDREWVDSLDSTIPAENLEAESPPEVERLAMEALGGMRAHLERRVVNDLLRSGATSIVLDGALIGRESDRRLLGVVKSTNRKYLADESCLYGLRAGWRSPRFVIPAGTAGSSVDRYSCYLRLHDASSKPWNFALIRLECFEDPDLLDPLAARCLTERQPPTARDARWDRHLQSVRTTEDFLRARRPSVFSMG